MNELQQKKYTFYGHSSCLCVYVHCIEVQTKTVLLTNPDGTMTIFGSVAALGRFQSIYRVLPFIDHTSKDTLEEPQKLYPNIRHPNSKFQTSVHKTFQMINHLPYGRAALTSNNTLHTNSHSSEPRYLNFANKILVTCCPS
jgi:hypothetical protein